MAAQSKTNIFVYRHVDFLSHMCMLLSSAYLVILIFAT